MYKKISIYFGLLVVVLLLMNVTTPFPVDEDEQRMTRRPTDAETVAAASVDLGSMMRKFSFHHMAVTTTILPHDVRSARQSMRSARRSMRRLMRLTLKKVSVFLMCSHFL